MASKQEQPTRPEQDELDYAPKLLTPAQTVVMTIKILAIAGILILLIWLLIRAKS